MSGITGEIQLKHLFESCQKTFANNDFSEVRKQLDSSLGWFTFRQRRDILKSLRKICEDLEVSTKVTGKGDVIRIILGASYWTYQINEYAMTMGSSDSFRKKVWEKVESSSELTILDIDKIATYIQSI